MYYILLVNITKNTQLVVYAPDYSCFFYHFNVARGFYVIYLSIYIVRGILLRPQRGEEHGLGLPVDEWKVGAKIKHVHSFAYLSLSSTRWTVSEGSLGAL